MTDELSLRRVFAASGPLVLCRERGVAPAGYVRVGARWALRLPPALAWVSTSASDRQLILRPADAAPAEPAARRSQLDAFWQAAMADLSPDPRRPVPLSSAGLAPGALLSDPLADEAGRAAQIGRYLAAQESRLVPAGLPAPLDRLLRTLAAMPFAAETRLAVRIGAGDHWHLRFHEAGEMQALAEELAPALARGGDAASGGDPDAAPIPAPGPERFDAQLAPAWRNQPGAGFTMALARALQLARLAALNRAGPPAGLCVETSHPGFRGRVVALTLGPGDWGLGLMRLEDVVVRALEGEGQIPEPGQLARVLEERGPRLTVTAPPPGDGAALGLEPPGGARLARLRLVSAGEAAAGGELAADGAAAPGETPSGETGTGDPLRDRIRALARTDVPEPAPELTGHPAPLPVLWRGDDSAGLPRWIYAGTGGAPAQPRAGLPFAVAPAPHGLFPPPARGREALPPAFQRLGAAAQAEYIDWLDGPRRAAGFRPAFGHLYLQGLEFRLLEESGPEAERPALIHEIRAVAGLDAAGDALALAAVALLDWLGATGLRKRGDPLAEGGLSCLVAAGGQVAAGAPLGPGLLAALALNRAVMQAGREDDDEPDLQAPGWQARDWQAADWQAPGGFAPEPPQARREAPAAAPDFTAGWPAPAGDLPRTLPAPGDLLGVCFRLWPDGLALPAPKAPLSADYRSMSGLCDRRGQQFQAEGRPVADLRISAALNRALDLALKAAQGLAAAPEGGAGAQPVAGANSGPMSGTAPESNPGPNSGPNSGPETLE